MKVLMLLVADYASFERATGKLNILGAFTRITARQFPATHPRLAVVIKVGADLGDLPDDRTLTVKLLDADATELMQYSAPFRIPHGPGGVRPEFNAVLELNNLPFPQPGTYEFRVYIDEQQYGSISIEVVSAPQRAE
jgi:hypothetical protein